MFIENFCVNAVTAPAGPRVIKLAYLTARGFLLPNIVQNVEPSVATGDAACTSACNRNVFFLRYATPTGLRETKPICFLSQGAALCYFMPPLWGLQKITGEDLIVPLSQK